MASAPTDSDHQLVTERKRLEINTEIGSLKCVRDNVRQLRHKLSQCHPLEFLLDLAKCR